VYENKLISKLGGVELQLLFTCGISHGHSQKDLEVDTGSQIWKLFLADNTW